MGTTNLSCVAFVFEAEQVPITLYQLVILLASDRGRGKGELVSQASPFPFRHGSAGPIAFSMRHAERLGIGGDKLMSAKYKSFKVEAESR